MATSKSAPATVSGSNTSTTSETIAGSHVGWHVFRIDGFFTTKDLGVGKSIKSGTFRVGGHYWYIECYPCGDDEGNAGWVTLYLRRHDDHPAAYTASADCEFTLMEPLKDGCFKKLDGHRSRWVSFKDEPACTDFIKRERLESLLKDDCLQLRCIVFVNFPAVPQSDLATETISGSYMLTVNGYTKTRGEIAIGESVCYSSPGVAGHDWDIDFYPRGEDEDDKDGITTYLCLEEPGANDEVKVRFEITLLTHTGKKISSIQDFYTFSDENKEYLCKFLRGMEHESSALLLDGIQIRCDMTAVKGITEVQPPPNLALGTDVTFDVAGDLFSAHKCVLATRSTAFVAEFFGPGKENAGVDQVLRINDMEPMVFKALLHFIYTDSLPEVQEEHMVMMAQGPLVAADRYAMERLKLICADTLCSCIDATTAVATREMADKHGCVKLKEACIKVIKDWLGEATP